MANEKWKAHAVDTLRYVADNIDSYLPDEWILEDSELVVRIPDMCTFPTVELRAEMPAQPKRIHAITK